jgi:hypothetical protein
MEVIDMDEKQLALELTKLIADKCISSKDSIYHSAENAIECYIACLEQIKINASRLGF